ncbi:1,9-bis(guanidino)-5-aza-nonane synthase [Pelodictyon phaeoclathratiforme]|jgi:deoxyhypusine synthase|uniref:Deoxyhypusine synthase-like protein n=1 Tax=Pelodictyon phaeoclathratiforme (strain DSM 5477 / BU-1) TaxID=324925 RepID=B4SH31_PELPB|nr:deoxyhypusine synthase [Pelodictyon phaeoclathratiforme]ACF45019.1 deoxyhypusine synthase [Pelodictyon phaeoclathratiforme BU-1]MBV5288629.1 deoxyhypusine synthase [Pelodictyon phaeoclathratiforme]
MQSAFTKEGLLSAPVRHIDIKQLNIVPLIDQMSDTAFQARNLARAASILDLMQQDKECAVILTLAGSLISAGLKQVIIDMIENNMVDAIVSTGANIVDQDFFEALGFRHYKGSPFMDDAILRDLHIDRIYDTYIDEDDLRVCDDTTAIIANSMEPGAYSSREFIVEMAKYIEANNLDKNSIVYKAYEKGVPIFCPAFSDCSAGFGLVHHQWNNPEKHVSIDSVKDFRELTRIKIENDKTGIFMIGGGVPKNFTQDIVVAAEVLGHDDVSMHTYAVQITVADERDGALSGSTLKEASSWGKVDTVHEQMVFAEATIALPLIAGYAWHKRNWEGRQTKNFNALLDRQQVTV